MFLSRYFKKSYDFLQLAITFNNFVTVHDTSDTLLLILRESELHLNDKSVHLARASNTILSAINNGESRLTRIAVVRNGQVQRLLQIASCTAVPFN